MNKKELNKKEELKYFFDWLTFKAELINKDIHNKNYKITDNDKTEYLISLKKYEKRKLKDILKIKEYLKEI